MGKPKTSGLRLKRSGNLKQKNFRTAMIGENNLTIAVLSQAYSSKVDRHRGEVIALETLFNDPELSADADRLAFERITKKFHS